MGYNITFYCPDEHISYDLYTLENEGVGGGITARVRMAHALAMRGHRVIAYVNCPKERNILGVEYRHFSTIDDHSTDIFIAGTSGDGLDLSPLCGVDIHARLRILMTHGVDPPTGLNCQSFDFAYALSNFVRKKILKDWGFDKDQLFVTYRGVVESYYMYEDPPIPVRDLFSIAYASHPSKGLEETLAIFRLLREKDSKFTLHLYGGNQLWGQAEQLPPIIDGVFYHGMVGQKELIRKLQSHGFSLHLQKREEPFGMAIMEAMRAGCIILASPLGAYPELVEHDHNGFLIQGNSQLATTHEEAANIIVDVINSPDHAETIRDNASHTHLDWLTIADAWTEHFDWALGDRPSHSESKRGLRCSNCEGEYLTLSDGHHCTTCGLYERESQHAK